MGRSGERGGEEKGRKGKCDKKFSAKFCYENCVRPDNWKPIKKMFGGF